MDKLEVTLTPEQEAIVQGVMLEYSESVPKLVYVGRPALEQETPSVDISMSPPPDATDDEYVCVEEIKFDGSSDPSVAPEEPKKRARSGLCKHCEYCGALAEKKQKSVLTVPLCSRCYNKEASCYCCKVKGICGELYASPFFCSLGCLAKHHAAVMGTTVEKIAKKSGINLVFLPATEASDFYLLCNHILDHPEDRHILEEKANYQAEQLSAYMLYAIGGEIRHYHWLVGRKLLDKTLCLDACAFGVLISEWLKIKRGGTHAFREAMWLRWGRVAIPRFGKLPLIQVCQALFEGGDWEGSVGGKSWAKIANTLLLYEVGDINAITLVDTAWGLKHNNALHLNKMWSIEYLQQVLDANSESNYSFLMRLASKEVKAVVQEV